MNSNYDSTKAKAIALWLISSDLWCYWGPPSCQSHCQGSERREGATRSKWNRRGRKKVRGDIFSQDEDLHRGWAGCLAWSGRVPPAACRAGICLNGGSALLQGWSWVPASSGSIDSASEGRKEAAGVTLQDITQDPSTTAVNQELDTLPAPH